MQPIANIRCLLKACHELEIDYETLDNNGNFIRVQKNGSYYFINSNTPFNNNSSGLLMKDKEFSYKFLSKEIDMPKTIGYLDPEGNEEYGQYRIHKNIDEIADSIEKEFSFPLIIKMNRGARGKKVYKADTKNKIIDSLEAVYDKTLANYDYIALAQKFIDIKREFRVIWFRGEILLIYEKIWEEKDSGFSPLHNESGKAVLVEDTKIKERIENFLNKSSNLKDLEFSGLDIVIDENDKMFLLEVNASPGFGYFTRDNGDEELVEMYKKLLKSL